MSTVPPIHPSPAPPAPPSPPPPPPVEKALGVALVPDAANWRRWWSMRWMGVSGALQLVSQSLEELIAPARAGWALVPADWIARIPAWVPGAFGWAAILALAAAGLARMVQQRPPGTEYVYNGPHGHIVLMAIIIGFIGLLSVSGLLVLRWLFP